MVAINNSAANLLWLITESPSFTSLPALKSKKFFALLSFWKSVGLLQIQLTHWGQDKLGIFLQMTFWNQYFVCKLLYFGSHFTEVCP